MPKILSFSNIFQSLGRTAPSLGPTDRHLMKTECKTKNVYNLMEIGSNFLGRQSIGVKFEKLILISRGETWTLDELNSLSVEADENKRA